MLKIVPIVEGDGELESVPMLLRRLLRERLGYDERDFIIVKPKNAGGCNRLTTEDGIENYVRYALKEEGCTGVLVLIDNDAALALCKRRILEDDCAPCFANYLADRVRAINPPCPVVIVVVRWEYEAWFLANLETVGRAIGLPQALIFEGDVESLVGVKEWISDRLPSDQKYLPTRDQVKMTAVLDFDAVRERSPSFRRLEHALGQLVDAYLDDKVVVTPTLPH